MKQIYIIYSLFYRRKNIAAKLKLCQFSKKCVRKWSRIFLSLLLSLWLCYNKMLFFPKLQYFFSKFKPNLSIVVESLQRNLMHKFLLSICLFALRDLPWWLYRHSHTSAKIITKNICSTHYAVPKYDSMAENIRLKLDNLNPFYTNFYREHI